MLFTNERMMKMRKTWHCEICESKTTNASKRCDTCAERSIRMTKEINKRLKTKKLDKVTFTA